MQVIFFKQRNRAFLAAVNDDHKLFDRTPNDTYNEIGGIFFDLIDQKAIDFIYDEIWIQALKRRIDDRCGRLPDNKKAAAVGFFRFTRQGKKIIEPYPGAESDAQELMGIVSSRPQIHEFNSAIELKERVLADGFTEHIMKPKPTYF